MSLQRYHQKRNFQRTGEPFGRKHPTRSGHLYLIQKHAARHLHYDLRLEMDGVLKSWAVPKGPSLNPADKRLAVHVEDHPVEYGSFEGKIPKGEYGGGTVMLWDQGWWEPQQDEKTGYKKGSLKFILHGNRLKGGFALVRMGRAADHGKNWLLIKERDREAHTKGKAITETEDESVATGRSMEQIASDETNVWPCRTDKKTKRSVTKLSFDQFKDLPRAQKKPQPKILSPQLATLVKEIPTEEDWFHETKFDGYRVLAHIHRNKVQLMTRNGKDYSSKFSVIAKALGDIPLKQGILDGEIVVLKSNGISDFQALQNYLLEGARANLVYFVFDIPYAGGYDLTEVPLKDRKMVLSRLIGKRSDLVRFSEHIEGQGPKVFQKACKLGMEGIVSKKSDSQYHSYRSKDWLKVKCIKGQEFIIAGYTEPGGSRTGFGALLLGYYQDKHLIYAGKVGTGFKEESLKQIYQQLKKIKQKHSTFEKLPKEKLGKVHWVKPKLVGVVEFTEWTTDGRLRHPSFHGLREDKKPAEVIREQASPIQENSRKPVGRRSAKEETTAVADVNITHPDRIVFQEQGLTKLDLARYYKQVADRILPHISHRPLTLLRCPQGKRTKCFYQKNLTQDLPKEIHGIPHSTYFYIDSIKGLISLVQMGALEFHPWGSTIDQIEHPDRMVFDLDPGEGVKWKEVIHAALELRDLLKDLHLTSFVKTTGGKGLHLVVPLKPQADWKYFKNFSKAVADEMVRRNPKKYIATMSMSKRKGKIFVDYLRNARGATSVAAYSTRTRTGAPVSMPLSWQELATVKSGDAFHVKNVLQRIKGSKADPWAGFLKTSQTLPR